MFKAIANWWRSINRRRKVTILNSANRKEWHTHISPIRAVMVVCALIISLFLGMLLLVGYTSILEILPAYRTAADKSRDRLILNIERIDSMERVIGDMILYNDNVGLILEGKTPVARTTIISDSVRHHRTFTASNAADSALRAQMEGDGEYNIRSGGEQLLTQSNTISFSPPIEGIITERFDLKQERFGVRIAAVSEARIVAVEDGVVMQSIWTPESGTVVGILHPDNTVTIYKNLSQSIVAKGEAVQEGQIIGYNSKVVDNSSEQLFEFEMWRGGKPTNPERFILF